MSKHVHGMKIESNLSYSDELKLSYSTGRSFSLDHFKLQITIGCVHECDRIVQWLMMVFQFVSSKELKECIRILVLLQMANMSFVVFHLGQQNLHFQIGKAASQTHACSITVRQRGKWMDVIAGAALVGFQPAFGSKCIRFVTILVHSAGDNCGKDHLYALRNIVAANNSVFLQCPTVADNCAVDSVDVNTIDGE